MASKALTLETLYFITYNVKMKEIGGGSVIATLFVSSGAHLSNVHVLRFRNEITIHYCMKGRYSTQFHVSGKKCPQVPYCVVFQLGQRCLSQAEERENPD